jgi:hypothetical protein
MEQQELKAPTEGAVKPIDVRRCAKPPPTPNALRIFARLAALPRERACMATNAAIFAAVDRNRYPFCVVWGPLPCITCVPCRPTPTPAHPFMHAVYRWVRGARADLGGGLVGGCSPSSATWASATRTGAFTTSLARTTLGCARRCALCMRAASVTTAVHHSLWAASDGRCACTRAA